jgi:hypothetical protein
VKGALAIAILTISFDYGKHVVLKGILKRDIANSQGLVSVASLSVSPWPLLQNHLVLKNFQVHAPDTPMAVETVSVRQGWRDWRLAHIQATKIKSAEMVKVAEAQGILNIADLKTRVEVSHLMLRDIRVQLPLLAFSGNQATFNFLYEMAFRRLSLNVNAPEMSFSNGVTFGFSGEGAFEAKPLIEGEMAVKVKNIDKIMKELVTAGVVGASQADLVTASSNFLGTIGLHDITLPFKVKDGNVSLGPVSLFRLGKGEPDLILSRNF